MRIYCDSNPVPKYLRSDNGSLFLFGRWKVNLQFLETGELKSVPCSPSSHSYLNLQTSKATANDSSFNKHVVLRKDYHWNTRCGGLC
jgi:hypothetical protein